MFKTVLLAFIGLMLYIAPVRANEVEEITSPYGFKAWLIEDHSLPIVSVHMVFRKSGFAYDSDGKNGLAYLVRSLLDEGAGDMDGIAFKQALESHAIHLSFDVDEDNFYVRLKTLKENLPLALSLFKIALTSPRFDADAIERVRNQMRTYIDSRKEDPTTRADETFKRVVFGKHPYGNVPVGSKETLGNITKEDLQTFVKQHFTRVPLIISVVGDVRPKEATQFLDQYFVDLPLTTSGQASVAEFTEFPSGIEKSIAMDVPQSTVIFGLKGLKRDNPDFYTALVLNYIMGGGGLNSRLMEEVREKKGLAYTVDTSLEVFDHTGLIKGYVATQTAKIHESLAIIKQVFEQLQTKGVTKQEVEDAKSYLTGSFALNLDKNEKLADYLLVMQMENLGKDYLKERNRYIQAVTLEGVNRVAKALILPDNLITVIVGNPNESQAKNGESNHAMLSAGH